MMERIKSIVLTLLIFLSMFLTWSNWTYIPDYEPIKETEYIQDVAIGEKKELGQIVVPSQAFLHKDYRHYATTNAKEISSLYVQMQKWNFHMFQDMNVDSTNKFNEVVNRTKSVELYFPTEVPFNVLRNIFQFNEESVIINSIDRILIDLSNQNGVPEAYFISSVAQKVYLAQINNIDFDGFQKRYSKINKSFIEYEQFTIKDARSVYLPKNRISMKKMIYTTNSLSPDDFSNALFTDPSIVKRYPSKVGEEYFTDGTTALEIYSSRNLLKFTNPLRDEPALIEPAELIMNSFDYINDHAGWVDTYALCDWDIRNREVLFRMKLADHPVFDLETPEMVTISQAWSKGEVNKYSRSLIDLDDKLAEETVTLPGGADVIKAIEANENLNKKMIRGITAGYEFEKQDEGANFVSFTPAWFIQLENKRWLKVDFEDLSQEAKKGGRIGGLE